MLMIQVKLKHNDTYKTCWVDYHKDIRKGKFITLKDTDDRRWEIIEMYSKMSSSEINARWDNDFKKRLKGNIISEFYD